MSIDTWVNLDRSIHFEPRAARHCILRKNGDVFNVFARYLKDVSSPENAERLLKEYFATVFEMEDIILINFGYDLASDAICVMFEHHSLPSIAAGMQLPIHPEKSDDSLEQKQRDFALGKLKPLLNLVQELAT